MEQYKIVFFDTHLLSIIKNLRPSLFNLKNIIQKKKDNSRGCCEMSKLQPTKLLILNTQPLVIYLPECK